MAETNEENPLDALESDEEDPFASVDALSDDDLEVSEDELEAVFENAESTADISDGDEDFDLLGEDFSTDIEAPAEAPAEAPQAAPQSIEMLLDVELDIAIELGRTRRTIREVLEFTPGALIDLDALAGDPVNILCNDRLIAKGEVMVFDGKLAIRVNKIVEKEELIKRLG